MSAIRLYLPVIVVVLWAFAASVTNGSVVTVVALLVLAWALTVHIAELTRRRRKIAELAERRRHQ